MIDSKSVKEAGRESRRENRRGEASTAGRAHITEMAKGPGLYCNSWEAKAELVLDRGIILQV